MKYCVIVPSELSRGNEIVLNAMSSFDKYSHAMIQMSHQMDKVILTYNIAVATMQIKIVIYFEILILHVDDLKKKNI